MSQNYINYIMQNYGMPNDSDSDSDSDSDTNTDTNTESEYSSDISSENSLKRQKKNKNRKIRKGGAVITRSSDDNSDDLYDKELSGPNGGFPNIILCSEETKESAKENISRREIAADKAILSISQILKSRRNI